MYKMEIDIAGEKRIFLFRGSGCRRRMLDWYDDYLDKAAETEGSTRIRVWGTVGNKTDIMLEWKRGSDAGRWPSAAD